MKVMLLRAVIPHRGLSLGKMDEIEVHGMLIREAHSTVRRTNNRAP